MKEAKQKHWSIVEYLHETVTNTNIHIKGTKSYYSSAWTGSFEESVVRYLYGDAYSLKTWKPQWKIDQLYIGNYVCIGAEVIILMGGNNTHRSDWFSLYPFAETLEESYKTKGDTHIDDGAWLGIRSVLMPGIRIGEGAIVAAGAIVTKDVAPYSIVGGNPAKLIGYRFPEESIAKLLEMQLYSWPEEKFETLKSYICANDIDQLVKAEKEYKG
ncbi:CatB-related O-acetyltransferase [Sphingobacterium spiritivorum]|uniref:CatB-related O-acetyltransferase n=1 Tax=Sphingobacterium spiritivorum TaxID=258 RepID=UPI003DA3C672